MARSFAMLVLVALSNPIALAQSTTASVPPGSDARAIVIRPDGGLLVAGITEGSLMNQTHHGGIDAFIAWLTPDGELERVLQFGTEGDDRLSSIALNRDGELYVAGDTTSTFPAAQGTGAQFVTKIDVTGTITWTRHLGGDTSHVPPSITLDHDGTLYIAGSRPNGEVRYCGFVRCQVLPLFDVYVAHLNTDGAPLAEIPLVMVGNQASTSILLTSDGELILLGLRSDFPFTGESAPYRHGFAALLTPPGKLLAEAPITHPGDGTTRIHGVVLPNGLIGIADGSGTGIGEREDSRVGISYYAAIGALDEHLEWDWLKSFGAAHGYIGYGVAATSSGDLVVVGSGNWTVGGEHQGLSDVFVGTYSADGTRMWLTQYGTAMFDGAHAVATAQDGTIYVTGAWNGDWAHLRSHLGEPIQLGESWFIAAHDPDGEQLWIRTYQAEPGAP